MEVEIIHKRNIKPASATPNHLRNYRISLLDQLMFPAHVPLVFYYPVNPTVPHYLSVSKISQQLRLSLSKTLVHYYPFAGKIKDDDQLIVECNDEGAYYVEAKIKNFGLSQLLHQPEGHLIGRLLPEHPPNSDGTYVVMIQANIFDCGGIAITMSTCHKIVDAATFFSFLKSWAAIARGSSEIIYPSFVAPTIFPQNHLLPKHASLSPWIHFSRQGKCRTRRFVFSASAIRDLKAKASSSSVNFRATRVEAVSAFIWKHAMLASRARNNGLKRPAVLSHAVNLRRKKVPPLPEHAIGNILWTVPTKCKADEVEEDSIELLHLLAIHIREAMGKVNNGFIEQIKGEKGFSRLCEIVKELGDVYRDEQGTDYYSCTSLVNASVYDIDFGWGKPKWVSIGHTNVPVLMNLFFLMETGEGDGMEAWVSLDERDMSWILEHSSEVMAFASVDPSPWSGQLIKRPNLIHPRL